MGAEVTVIMPAYNAARYMDKALESVLAQTAACRVIVVNDASSDETFMIAERYAKKYPESIRVIDNEKNMGVAASRNRAVAEVETEYIAFLDADDWWSADKVEKQLRLIRDNDADACYSARELMTEDGRTIGKVVHVSETISYRKLLKGNIIPCSSVLMKRECALAYPMEHDELHEDYIVWLSMLRDGKHFVGIDEPLLKSRLGAAGKSRNKWKSARMTYGVYRHMGIPMWKAIWCFACYAIAGAAKYTGHRK